MVMSTTPDYPMNGIDGDGDGGGVGQLEFWRGGAPGKLLLERTLNGHRGRCCRGVTREERLVRTDMVFPHVR